MKCGAGTPACAPPKAARFPVDPRKPVRRFAPGADRRVCALQPEERRHPMERWPLAGCTAGVSPASPVELAP